MKLHKKVAESVNIVRRDGESYASVKDLHAIMAKAVIHGTLSPKDIEIVFEMLFDIEEILN